MESDGGVRSVTLGRIVAIVAMGIAMVAAKPLLGNFEQAFQYIQEFTGFSLRGLSRLPCWFVLGSHDRYCSVDRSDRVGGPVALFQVGVAGAIHGSCWAGLLCVAIGVMWSLATPIPGGFVDPAGVSFSTTQGFNVSAVLVTLILVFFYTVWW